MKIYLAGPFFKEYQRNLVNKYAKILREVGHEVYVPMEHEVEDAWSLPHHEWANKVFKADVDAIDRCDKVVALYEGWWSDTGTAWEIGYAYGIGTPVVLIPFGKAEEDNEALSVMIVNSVNNIEDFKERKQK